MDDLASAQRFQPLPELRRRPEAAVGFKAGLRHDGYQLIKLLVQRFKRVQNAGNVQNEPHMASPSVRFFMLLPPNSGYGIWRFG